MKRKIIVAVAAITLITAGIADAGVSIVMNGSFENDGSIPNITTKSPRYWCDVDLLASRFGGWVNEDASTHGGYCLTLYSQMFETFTAGETATVSQSVYLEDVNQIIFDVTLGSIWGTDYWDPNRSAVVKIDGNTVWDSVVDLGPGAKGLYTDVAVDVNGAYKDPNLHVLSLSIKVNSGGNSNIQYWAQWDFVKFNTHCGGFGYMPEDFDRDCCVDINDLGAIAGQWLSAEPNERYDLFTDGVVNFQDYVYLAEYWKCTSRWENWQDSNFVEMEVPVSDMDNSGRVDYGDILIMGSNWLTTGDCLGADLNRDRKVDSKDFTILNSQWQEKSWLLVVE
jgi:hypothetical protein